MLTDEEKLRRYQNLMIEDALSQNHIYPFACNELANIVLLIFSRLPKNIKALILRDTLSAFRLLPDVNTSAAESAADSLLKIVEIVFPKQKMKKLAIVEFKQAKIALKRRSKSHEKDIDLPSLPQDILIHIFSFLDVSSLLSSSQVSRSWNQATSDDSLWRSRFDFHFNIRAWNPIQSGIDWREAFKKAYIVTNSSSVLRSGLGCCSCCGSIVWYDKLRCPNKQCRLKSGNEPLHLISENEVIDNILGIVRSSEEIDANNKAVLRYWDSYPKIRS